MQSSVLGTAETVLIMYVLYITLPMQSQAQFFLQPLLTRLPSSIQFAARYYKCCMYIWYFISTLYEVHSALLCICQGIRCGIIGIKIRELAL